LFLGPRSFPFIKTIRWDKAPPLDKSLPKRRFDGSGLGTGINNSANFFNVAGPGRNKTP